MVLRLPTAGRYKPLILDTSYLILFLMSNVELRMMKEEVGIRVMSQIVLLRVLACLSADRVLGNSPAYRRQVQILDT